MSSGLANQLMKDRKLVAFVENQMSSHVLHGDTSLACKEDDRVDPPHGATGSNCCIY